MPLHRHNPALSQKLLPYIVADDPSGLYALLQSLTVAEFRTAGYLLAEDLLVRCPSSVFWHFFLEIVPRHSKAYLGTFLKAASHLFRSGGLALDEDVLGQFAKGATVIDIRKTLDAFLAMPVDAAQAELLVRLLADNRLDLAAPQLLKAGTPVAYYVLFCLLRTAEADHALLRHYAVMLIRKGDPLSFKMASVLRQYFDLKDLPGHFSLQLAPYELSRLEQGYSAFMATIS